MRRCTFSYAAIETHPARWKESKISATSLADRMSKDSAGFRRSCWSAFCHGEGKWRAPGEHQPQDECDADEQRCRQRSGPLGSIAPRPRDAAAMPSLPPVPGASSPGKAPNDSAPLASCSWLRAICRRKRGAGRPAADERLVGGPLRCAVAASLLRPTS